MYEQVRSREVRKGSTYWLAAYSASSQDFADVPKHAHLVHPDRPYPEASAWLPSWAHLARYAEYLAQILPDACPFVGRQLLYVVDLDPLAGHVPYREAAYLQDEAH